MPAPPAPRSRPRATTPPKCAASPPPLLPEAYNKPRNITTRLRCRRAAKSCCDDVHLGRFGSARRGLGVADYGEIALQRRQQRARGAALEDLGQEGAARRQHLGGKGG